MLRTSISLSPEPSVALQATTDGILGGELVYAELKRVATLSRRYIERNDHTVAVSIFRDVMSGTDFEATYARMERVHPFVDLVQKQECLWHETMILQMALVSYFKLQIFYGSPALGRIPNPGNMIDVIERLKHLYSRKAHLNRVWIDIDLTLSRTAQSFSSSSHRSALLMKALGLANQYSTAHEFKTAQGLFELRLTFSDLFRSFQSGVKSEIESWMEQHKFRIQNTPSKPPCLPWSRRHVHQTNYYSALFSIPPPSEARLQPEHLHRLLRQFSNNHKLDSSTPPPARAISAPSFLEHNKRIKVIHIDSGEERGFTSSSSRSYRYGVSISDSDVPWIDLSRYMAQ